MANCATKIIWSFYIDINWDIGKQVSASAGVIASPTLRGGDQLRFALEDVIHGVNLGLRSVLVGDLGLLKVLGEAKRKGDLPKALFLKPITI